MDYNTSTQIINNFLDHLASLKENVDGFSAQFLKLNEPHVQLRKSTLQDVMEDFSDCIVQSAQTIKSIQAENLNLKEKLEQLEKEDPVDKKYVNPFHQDKQGLDVIAEMSEEDTERKTEEQPEYLEEEPKEEVQCELKQGLRHRIISKTAEKPREEPSEEPREEAVSAEKEENSVREEILEEEDLKQNLPSEESTDKSKYDNLMRLIISKLVNMSAEGKRVLGELHGKGNFQSFFDKLLKSEYYFFELEDIQQSILELDRPLKTEDRQESKRKRGGQRDQTREVYSDPLSFKDILRNYQGKTDPAERRVLSPSGQRRTNF